MNFLLGSTESYVRSKSKIALPLWKIESRYMSCAIFFLSNRSATFQMTMRIKSINDVYVKEPKRISPENNIESELKFIENNIEKLSLR